MDRNSIDNLKYGQEVVFINDYEYDYASIFRGDKYFFIEKKNDSWSFPVVLSRYITYTDVGGIKASVINREYFDKNIISYFETKENIRNTKLEKLGICQ